MKIKLLFTIFLLLVVSNCFGQIMFQRIINTQYNCGANAVQQTTDGGYILTGIFSDSTIPDGNVYLIKTNNEGDTLWTKIFGVINNYYDNGESVQQTTDGGYIVAGNTTDSSLDKHIYVIKTNTYGDTLWTKAYGGDSSELGYFVQQTNDGGYIITGSTNSFGAGNTDVYLLKIDAGGNITWTKTYGGSSSDEGYCVKQTPDSGYIIVGSTESFGDSNGVVYLIKTNVNGDTLWTKTYGGTKGDVGYSVQQTTFDNGYIITGFTYSFGANSDGAVYLIKANSNGDTLWTKTYSSNGNFSNIDLANNVQQTTDGGYIITSNTAGGGYTAYINANLIKTNFNGDTLWTKSYSGVNYYSSDYNSSVQQTNDGGYIIEGVGVSDRVSVHLIKTDANGNSGCDQGNTNTIVGFAPMQIASTNTIVSSGGTAFPSNTIVGSGGNDSTLCLTVGINEQSINNTILIYPNPTTDFIHIKNSTINRFENFQVINILGQVLLNVKPVSSSGIETINVSNLADGIYCFEAIVNNQKYSSRFIISR